jgi:hypothetical protein
MVDLDKLPNYLSNRIEKENFHEDLSTNKIKTFNKIAK